GGWSGEGGGGGRGGRAAAGRGAGPAAPAPGAGRPGARRHALWRATHAGVPAYDSSPRLLCEMSHSSRTWDAAWNVSCSASRIAATVASRYANPKFVAIATGRREGGPA